MRCYTYIFASVRHRPIRTLAQRKKLGRWDSNFVFLLNGKPIGEADLRPYKGDCLHTAKVGLDRGSRRKGHGLPLYLALIRCARRLGATRLYSDSRLNKFSRRMWATKLARLFVVNEMRGQGFCRHCGRRHRCQARRYFIVL